MRLSDEIFRRTFPCGRIKVNMTTLEIEVYIKPECQEPKADPDYVIPTEVEFFRMPEPEIAIWEIHHTNLLLQE